MPGRPFSYVAIEGVIGVGKTTLVNRLAPRLGARTVFEQFEENPFLPDFYKDRQAFAFSTQLFFLMSRFQQQSVIAQPELFRSFTLSDYVFDKDRIFALLTLESHELALYERLFDVLRVQVPRPDLLVFLRADHDVVMARIAERDRPYERGMDPEYIRSVSEAYAAYFARYDQCPVITLDTSEMDFRADDAAVERLASAIERADLSLVRPHGLAQKNSDRLLL